MSPGRSAAQEAGPPAAASPRVEALLFWSTTCEHCHKVIEEVLPTWQERYGDKLHISFVEIQSVAGYDLWRKVWDVYGIPEDRRGVPMLVIGDQVLLGEVEIVQYAPNAVDGGLAAGGIPLPPALGVDTETAGAHHQLSVALLTATPPRPAATAASTPAAPAQGSPAPAGLEGAEKAGTLAASTDVSATRGVTTPLATTTTGAARPALARALAWLVFAGLIATTAYGLLALGRAYLQPRRRPLWAPPAMFDWLLPLVAIVGSVVAAYLTNTEVTGNATFCPVGACDKVQSSSYARLPIPYPRLIRDPAGGSPSLALARTGLPVAALGLLTYLLVVGLWLWWKYGRGRTKPHALEALYGLILIGVLFSTYLTALELFVIKEVCMWCLMSAVAMALLLWLALPPMADRLVAVRLKSVGRPAAGGRAAVPTSQRHRATSPASQRPTGASTGTRSQQPTSGRAARRRRGRR